MWQSTNWRFLLPDPANTVSLLGPPCARAPEGHGIALAPTDSSEPARVVLADPNCLAAAIQSGADQIIVAGRTPASRLRRHGYDVTRVLTLPTRANPMLMLPLNHPNAYRYAFDNLVFPRTLLKRARKRLVGRTLGVVVPPNLPILTLAQKRRRAPFFLAAAVEFGVPTHSHWFLRIGQGSALTRSSFFAFAPESPQPGWIIKFARFPDCDDRFDADERGLTLAREAGTIVARHAPQLLGRFEVGDLAASVETAALGKPLVDVLLAPGSRRRKLALIEDVAAWIVEFGVATLAPSESTRAECLRIEKEVLPLAAVERGAELLERVHGVGAVLQHNDLGCWNIVVDHRHFSALDWEAARRHGFPLWDLWLFLSDALATLDRTTREERSRYFVRLFLGELPSSAVLFSWTRRAVQALRLPAETVGPLASLCWLHHASSERKTHSNLTKRGLSTDVPSQVMLTLPKLWLKEPGLGPDWNRWND